MKLYSTIIFFLFTLCCTLNALETTEIPIIKYSLNREDKRTCHIAITTVFRDEAKHMAEWIEYHRLIGVEHFYLYNNCSSDNYLEVLKPYIQDGIAELFDVPFDSFLYNGNALAHNLVQVSCFNHAIHLASDTAHWLAIIDADEFICPVTEVTLEKALQPYDYAGGLAVYWQCYGTSNIWDLGKGELLIEKLLLKAPDNAPCNFQFKSIVKPKYAQCINPHYTTVEQSGLPFVLPNHEIYHRRKKPATLPIDVIRINHYVFRTESWYQTVKKPRREMWGEKIPPSEEKKRMDLHNSVYDPIMLKFVPELKQRLQPVPLPLPMPMP